MSERVTCIVPHCRRTRRYDGDGAEVEGVWVPFKEWICQPHWSAVPPALRRLYTAARRRLRRRGSYFAYRVGGRVWRRCKIAAMEAAAGIA